MTARQQVFALAEKIGATVQINLDSGFEVKVEAPQDKHWSDGLSVFY